MLKNILANIRALFTTNLRKRDNDNASRIAMLEEIVDNYILYNNIQTYYLHHTDEASDYQRELEYLCGEGQFRVFPYPPNASASDIKCGIDEKTKLPFVLHGDKRLYYPLSYSIDRAVSDYNNLINIEKLLGMGDLDGTPHQYQSPIVHVSEGDVVFDIGAAEGLFALDQVDKASKLVIVESEKEWIKPLQHTFAPYQDKVVIEQKFVSSSDTDKTISLGKLLSSYDCFSAFVKMDIEGYELSSLLSAVDVLKQKNGLKMSIATYHRQRDFEEIGEVLKQLGFYTESSNGYMLFHLYDTPTPPYFRHGVIRATNKKNVAV